MSGIAHVIQLVLSYGPVTAGLIYLAKKKTHLLVILLGIVALLAAVPVGFVAEIGMNGCCGAPSTGRRGDGFALGALLSIVGFALLIFSSRFKKKSSK